MSGGSAASASDTTTDDAATQQEAAAAADQTSTTTTKRVRVASSSTKVTFSSDVDTALPTLESVRGQSFPWGWVVGGFAGLGAAIYLAVRLAERKKR